MRAIHRHTALVEFLSVAQHILAHLTQVDVEVTTVLRSIVLFTGIDERIHQPELDIFHIGRLEIVRVEPAHHTAPTLLGNGQCTIGIQVGIQVIRTAFRGIESKVQDGQCSCSTIIATLVACRIELLDIDLAYIMVRELVQIALDMTRCE